MKNTLMMHKGIHLTLNDGRGHSMYQGKFYTAIRFRHKLIISEDNAEARALRNGVGMESTKVSALTALTTV